MVIPSCFSILGIDLFSASMRAWRCSAMRMVWADVHELTTAPEMAATMRAKPRPARSTVDFIACPPGAAFQPLAYLDNLECTRLHKLGNRVLGPYVPAAERAYYAGIAGQFFFDVIMYTCAQMEKYL